MKITELETFVVGNPPPHFGGRYFVFLKLVTDDGVEGVGEVYTATFGPHTVARMIEDVFERHVIGTDPFRIERAVARRLREGYSARPDISLLGVLSGIEMACWDIVGKAVGKPVYELLGGKVHERLRAYTYLYRSRATRRRLPRSRACRRAGRRVRGARASRRSSSIRPGPTRRSTPDSRASRSSTAASATCGSVREAVGTAATSCSAPTASSRRPARSVSRAASSSTTRSGSRSRPRPRCRRRWHTWRARRRSRSRRASG